MELNSTYKNSIFFECSLIGFLLVLSIKIFSSINYFTLIVCLMVVFLKEYEAILCMCMFLLSFLFVFKLNVGSGFAFINFVELGFLLRLLFDNHFKLPLFKSKFVYIFCFYSFFVSVFSGLNECIKIIVTFLISVSLFNGKHKYSLLRLVRYASAGDDKTT